MMYVIARIVTTEGLECNVVLSRILEVELPVLYSYIVVNDVVGVSSPKSVIERETLGWG
jgi:hypothetical protein